MLYSYDFHLIPQSLSEILVILALFFITLQPSKDACYIFFIDGIVLVEALPQTDLFEVVDMVLFGRGLYAPTFADVDSLDKDTFH